METDEAKETYHNIVIDTADLAYDAVEAHTCAIHGVDAIGDVGGGYGKGYKEAGDALDRALRKISKMGYGVILISHAQDRTITDENGKEFNRITPTLANTPRKIVNRFADIIGYARIVQVADAGEKTYLYLRATTRWEAGSRFKYTPLYIEFNYQNIVDAIANAIDQQAQETSEYVTDEDSTHEVETIPVDWDTAIADFKDITSDLVAKEVDKKRIKYIIEQHIGKNKTVTELDPSDINAEIVMMITDDLKDLQKLHS